MHVHTYIHIYMYVIYFVLIFNFFKKMPHVYTYVCIRTQYAHAHTAWTMSTHKSSRGLRIQDCSSDNVCAFVLTARESCSMKACLFQRHYCFTDILTTSQTFLLLYICTDSKGVLLKDERNACLLQKKADQQRSPASTGFRV